MVSGPVKKLCDQFDLDFPMDLDFTLTESENMEIIRNKIGGGDELDLSAREMNKYAEAMALQQHRARLEFLRENSSIKHHIVLTALRDRKLISTLLEKRGFGAAIPEQVGGAKGEK